MCIPCSDSTESALEIDSSDSVGAGQIPPEQAAFMQGRWGTKAQMVVECKS